MEAQILASGDIRAAERMRLHLRTRNGPWISDGGFLTFHRINVGDDTETLEFPQVEPTA